MDQFHLFQTATTSALYEKRLVSIKSQNRITVEKSYASELENKMSVFKTQTKTTKTIFLTMVTTFGIKKNEHATRLIQNEITMDALFK